MDKPAISIVIPAKNEASVLGEVVSAAREECPDAEIIVVDDNSTDETADVVLHEDAGNLVEGAVGERERREGAQLFLAGCLPRKRQREEIGLRLAAFRLGISPQHADAFVVRPLLARGADGHVVECNRRERAPRRWVRA